jgi:type I restriction-modification system DNA methylase subunit
MNQEQARDLVHQTLTQSFERTRFRNFALELLNDFDESKAFSSNKTYIKDAFKGHVERFDRLGTYTSPESEKLDVLVVHLTKQSKLERARTAIRNFVADHLKQRDGKDAALVAFVSPTEKQWRFSYVKMEYATVEKDSGKIDVKTRLTPARRFSYIVGEGESCHTAQTRFLDLLQDTESNPVLAEIEEAFSVEAVTREFFEKYAELFTEIQKALDKLAAKDPTIGKEFTRKNIKTADFAKKLMGQIVFLYFIQKKGWMGVAKGHDWGTGPHDFLRHLARGDYGGYDNFFNDVLEPLFYDTLATDRGHEAWCKRFNCRIPFLNGGLFEPLADYDWRKTDIVLPNRLFTNNDRFDDFSTGTGLLDMFDRYNFTVNEAEPLEKEVAIDPEMLGKVFENLIEENLRKGLGSYYTPREIVHYMCQESLINYLDTALNSGSETIGREKRKQAELSDEKAEQTLLTASTRREFVPRADIETFVRLGDQISHYESVETRYAVKMAKSIEKHARLIDEKLADVTICDPAVGSGAFPVGMMTEIVRARSALTPYFNDVHDRTPYHFKRHAIQNCLYGVDIDPGAVEIAKLRLWLSLVVDEEDVKQIKPLPNLFYKIVRGNSLLGVEKTLFNEQVFRRLEQLKPRYFDETDHAKKEKLKNEIHELIHELTSGEEIFDFEIYFSEVFHSRHGFDVLLANPPYIGQKGNKEIFQEIARTDFGKKFHQRRMDLFYFFIHRALDLGHAQTQIAFITTNYFITATYADKLRRDLFNRGTFRSLINFNELRIFESALGQHNMVSLFQRGKEPNVIVLTATTKRVGFATPLILNSIVSGHDPETEYRRVNQSDLYQGDQLYMTLGGHHESSSDPIMAILAKVGRNGTLLGTLTKISQGIVTGADRLKAKYAERYPHAGFSVGEGVFVLTSEECVRKRISLKSSHVRPWFKNSDIKKYWTAGKTGKWLLYFKDEKQKQSIEEPVLKHFKRFEQALVDRLSVCKKNQFQWNIVSKWIARGEFYLLFYPRKPEVFDGEKVVSPQRSYTNTFGYNNSPWYASADVYFINPMDRAVSLKYILAVLNSKLVFIWLYHRGKRKGEMLELYQKPLSEIPVKRISPDEQKPFIRLVDRILVAKQRDADANTSALEREIDELVYALYGLTSEEIKIVESAFAKKASA